MSERNAKMRQGVRLLLIVALAGLSVGLITYSCRAVSYRVDGVPQGELVVTELSLTHSVERGPDGKLFDPYAAEERAVEAEKSKPAAGVDDRQSQTEELAAKKPPPKKKPALKKPKKPAPKKPGKGKAKPCPT